MVSWAGSVDVFAGLDDPASGDSGAVLDLSRSNRDWAVKLDRAADNVRSARSTVAQNTSVATDFLAASLADSAPKMRTVSDTLQQHARALAAYAADIESISRSAAQSRSIVDGYLQQLDRWRWKLVEIAPTKASEIDAASWDSPPPLAALEDATASSASASAAPSEGGSALDADTVERYNAGVLAWQSIDSEIFAERDRYRALIERRHAADLDCIASFDSSEMSDALRHASSSGEGSVPSGSWAMGKGVSLADMLDNDPAKIIEALSEMTPMEVAIIWPTLPAWARSNLPATHPDIIGNLEGLPYAIRNKANVLHLREEYWATKAEIEKLVAADEFYEPKTMIETHPNLVEKWKALQELFHAYAIEDATQADPPRLLVNFDTNEVGAPLVSVSVGDLDNAPNITVLVPGMNSSSAEIDDLVGIAATLQRAIKYQGTENAVVAWGNYISPDMRTVTLSDHAISGASRFGQSLDGLNAVQSHEKKDRALNVVAHSYATTMTSISLSQRDYGISSYSMIGSAGLVPTIDHASKLHVPEGRVFAMDNKTDMLNNIGMVGAHPVNPVDGSFGARVLGSDGITLDDGTRLEPAKDHALGGERDHYLSSNTESFRNMVSVLTGASDEITLAKGTSEIQHRGGKAGQ